MRAFLSRSRWRCVALIGALALVCGGHNTQAQDAPPRQERQGQRRPRLLVETVRPLRHESRVIRAHWIQDPAHTQACAGLLSRYGFAVLDQEKPGITLHFHAPAIEPMSWVDLLYEGRPATAHSLGRVVDQAIAQARDQGVLIERITLTGHAGLPGCCALGARLEDCVFNGRLSETQTRQLRRLRRYLAEDAVIELRQCTSAAGDEGTALLTAIHRAARCTVVSYVGDFRFGFSGRATIKRVDAEGHVEVVEDGR